MTTEYKFLKVSRGFANTVLYFRVTLAQVAEADAAFATFADDNPGCHAAWVGGQDFGDRLVDWADRAYVGY